MKWYKVLIMSLMIMQSLLVAVPAQVVILRHGEKVSHPKSQYAALSERGQQRASALANFFASDKARFLLHAPDYILAITPRTLETISPTANLFNKSIYTYFGMTIPEIYEKTKAAARDILNNRKYDGKVLIAAWEHDNIPVLATHLNAKPVHKWGHETFDRFWVLNFNCDGNATVQDIPQKLLPGDSIE